MFHCTDISRYTKSCLPASSLPKLGLFCQLRLNLLRHTFGLGRLSMWCCRWKFPNHSRCEWQLLSKSICLLGLYNSHMHPYYSCKWTGRDKASFQTRLLAQASKILGGCLCCLLLSSILPLEDLRIRQNTCQSVVQRVLAREKKQRMRHKDQNVTATA